MMNLMYLSEDPLGEKDTKTSHRKAEAERNQLRPLPPPHYHPPNETVKPPKTVERSTTQPVENPLAF